MSALAPRSLHEAFDRWWGALTEAASIPFPHTGAAGAEFDRLGQEATACETAILDASTPDLDTVAVKLWLALAVRSSGVAVADAVQARDVDALCALGDEMDGNEALIASALHTLRTLLEVEV